MVLAASVVLIAAACGSAQPTVVPATSVSPSPTASAEPASSVPAPSATVDPGQAALRGFLALITKDGFSYQATFTGESRHTTDILPISKGVLEVSGRNVLVRATFKFPAGHTYVVEHRYVTGRAWIRFLPAVWQRLARFTDADSMGAFAAVHGTSDVTYLGPKAVGGQTRYQLRFRSAILNPVMIPATNLTEVVVTSTRLTLLVDATGRPVSGTAEIVGRGRVSGQLQEIVIDLDLIFSKVGQPVAIAAP
jgi:hypothetical protein